MKIPIPKSGIPIPARLIPIAGRLSAPPPRRDNSAYKSAEHKQWAEQVKRRAGHACQRCGRAHIRLYADHIKELADGGTWAIENGQALCGSCHTVKTLAEKAKRWSRL